MEPYLRHGETVRLVAPARRRPRFGDVALVERADGALRLHRLVWPILPLTKTPWRSQADAAWFTDGPVAVLGTVESQRALGGAWAGLRALLVGMLCRLREKRSR